MTSAVLAMTNETRKGLVIFWDYKFNMIVELLGIVMIFTGVVFFMGRGELAKDDLQSSLLGFIITAYAMTVISQMSWTLMNEAQTGTLEQMYMSPLPSGLLIFGRTVASIITGTIEMILVAVILILLFNIEIAFAWQMISVLIITLIGLAGFGYMVAGATIVFKASGAIGQHRPEPTFVHQWHIPSGCFYARLVGNVCQNLSDNPGHHCNAPNCAGWINAY